MPAHSSAAMRATTILCVRRGGEVALVGDGQVTLGDTIVKGSASKIRRYSAPKRAADGKEYTDEVLFGFAGATADAFTLMERFEKRLMSHYSNLQQVALDLAKDWRTDKVLRELQAMLLVADKSETLILSGAGDVISPEHDTAAIGSGAAFAEAAARALLMHSDLPAAQLARSAMAIAADICIYTNNNLTLEEIKNDRT